MIRTFLLLATATAVMAGMNITGVTAIPWVVVILPVCAPAIAWLAASALAIGVIGVAMAVEWVQSRAAKK
jgi:hypothetical protein